jgi:hypothetical protein
MHRALRLKMHQQNESGTAVEANRRPGNYGADAPIHASNWLAPTAKDA